MARAGDGKARSNARRRTETVSLRLDATVKAGLVREAQRLGYPSLAALILERSLDVGRSSELGAREGRVLCGRLGQIGGLVNALIDTYGKGGSARTDALATIAEEIVTLQRDILAGRS